MKYVFDNKKEDIIFEISRLFLDLYITRIYLDTNKELTEKEKYDYRMGFIHGMRCGLISQDFKDDNRKE